MTQADIFEILKEAKSPLKANEIVERLKAKGIEINLSSFYRNMTSIKKDKSVKFEDKPIEIPKPTSKGTIYYISKRRVWWIEKEANNAINSNKT